MDEEVLREILRAGMAKITDSLLCPIHRVAEPIVGTLLSEADFALTQLSGLPDPICIMELAGWDSAFLRCPNRGCEHYSKQRCPRCGNWQLEFRWDGPLFAWHCAACPLTMELIEDPPSGIIMY